MDEAGCRDSNLQFYPFFPLLNTKGAQVFTGSHLFGIR